MSRRRFPRRTPQPSRRLAHAPQDAAPGPEPLPHRWWLLWPALWLAVLLTYQPAWHGGLVWDDIGHVTRPDLRSLSGLWRIWFDIGATQQYYPVVHSSFWLLHRLWGDHVVGYHVVNISLHATSAFLIALVLRRLAVPGAVLGAVLFALHPVQVETVAWITELKNTMSTAWYLAAALAYLRFDRQRDRRFYLLSLGLFVLAIFSKSVTATLPASLLVLFWWQRGRLSWRADVRPLLPFFVLGVGGGAMTAWFERTVIGASGSEFQLHALERLLLAGRVVWFYLGKLAWPSDLLFIYPRWHVTAGNLIGYLYPAALLVALAICWRVRARTRAPLASLLLFLIALAPALGFINVYPFRYSFVADHFQYLATIPALALFASAAVTGAASRAGERLAEPALIVMLSLPLAVLSWRDSRRFVSGDELLRETVAGNPACWMCHDNLAVSAIAGDPASAEAVQHLLASLELNPLNPEAWYNLAGTDVARNDLNAAVHHYAEAARLRPSFLEAHQRLGATLQRLRRHDEAIVEFRLAIGPNQRRADAAIAHFNLGVALAAAGRLLDALGELQVSLRLVPQSAVTLDQIGYVWLQLHRPADALAPLHDAIRLEPAVASTHDTLGSALLALDRLDESVSEYRSAVQLAPSSAEYRNNLGAALLEAGRFEEAATELRALVRQQPDAALVHYNLGAALANMGQYDEAIAEFRIALAQDPDHSAARSSLDEALRLRGRR